VHLEKSIELALLHDWTKENDCYPHNDVQDGDPNAQIPNLEFEGELRKHSLIRKTSPDEFMRMESLDALGSK
jgi:hypothetical protein